METIETTPKFGAAKVRHYTGARMTRVTYQGIWRDSEGVEGYCPHHGHRTVLAAAKCAKQAHEAR